MKTPALLLATLILALTTSKGAAQRTLAAFSVWKPKDGQAANFEAGYKQHLKWHRSAGDLWDWYGWLIISGPRDGQFIDATFGHAWSDLDHRVDPAGDGADNALHTEPFADFLSGSKWQRLPFSAAEDSTTLGARYLRMLTIDVSNAAAAITIIQAAAAAAPRKFLAYEKLDGGALPQLLLLFPSTSFTEYGEAATWQNTLLDLDHKNPRPVITSLTAETLLFRRDLTLLTTQP